MVIRQSDKLPKWILAKVGVAQMFNRHKGN